MSAHKRPHESSGEAAETKPKDWRDAFLEDDRPRRRDRSRSRERDYRRRDGRREEDRRPRDHHRDGGLNYDYDDRSHRDRSRNNERDRDRGLGRREGDRSRYRGNHARDGNGSSARAPSAGGSSRPYPPREQRGGAAWGYERDLDRRRHIDQPGRLKGDDREEGEIDSPPPAPVIREQSVTASPSSSANVPAAGPGRPAASDAPPPRGFQALRVPTQPRSSVPQVRPEANALDGDGRGVKKARVETEEEEQTGPVIVIEEERDPEKVLEERRRKREEIMAKFKAGGGKAATPAIVLEGKEAAGSGAESVGSGGTRTGVRTGLTTTGATPLLKALGTRSTVLAATASATTPALKEPSLANTPLGNDFDLGKQDAPPGATTTGGDDLVSAADYDPSAEGAMDQARRDRDNGVVQHAKAVADGVGEPIVVPDDEWEEVEMEMEEEDEEVDMFSAFEDSDRPKKKRKVKVRRKKVTSEMDGTELAPVIEIIGEGKPKAAMAVADNVDDGEGYYRITPGEIVDDGRYQITITLGKGMFSAVVKAKVLKAVGQERRQDVVGKEVAIKVIRSQESMYVAGRKEAQILKRLNEADPDDKKHIVRMEHTFEHHGHLCIVTESLSMNLRDVLKRFGKDVGLNLRAVRAYAHQMFLALSLMRKCSIVHADIKPDNVLVSENKATLKVCDFGSASDVADGDITPYLVSRFYRAPEIILGLPFDTSIDIWSIGCTLYELYTGKILFPGRSNNHMLLLMMEVKGKINHRLIKKATFGEMYFDESMNFLSVEKDKITGADVLKTLVISGPSRDIRSRIMPSSAIQLKMKDDEIKQMSNFVDLLDKCLQLDPAKRITPRDALLHTFVAG